MLHRIAVFLPFLVRIEVIVSSPGRDGKRETEVLHRDRQRQKHREGEGTGREGRLTCISLRRVPEVVNGEGKGMWRISSALFLGFFSLQDLL